MSMGPRTPLRLLGEELARSPKLTATALALSIVAAGAEGLTLALLLGFLRAFAETGDVTTGVAILDQWTLGGAADRDERLIRYAALVVAATAFRATAHFAGDYMVAKTRIKVITGLQARMLEVLHAVEYRYFIRSRSADLVGAVTAEIAPLGAFLSDASVLLVRSIFVLIYGVVLAAISWRLAVVAIAAFAIVAVALTFLTGRARAASRDVTQALQHSMAETSELITGIRAVRLSDQVGVHARRSEASRSRYVAAAVRSAWLAAIITPFSEGAGSVIVVAIMLLGALHGLATMAELLTFLFVLVRLAGAVRWMNQARGQLASNHGALGRVAELLEMTDKPLFVNGTRQFSGLTEGIRFENVGLVHDDGTQALSNLDLELRRGATVALVGPSGGGKSTIGDLLVRLQDPTSGRILVDGIDLREIEVSSFRARVAVVSQETFLFNMSVRENLTYGLTDVPEARLRQAAEAAGAHTFIEELPQGFDTVLGDRGLRLSGGQRQRLAIARAILRDPEILVLDEATSALDAASERAIQDALAPLMVGRTVLVIAHRLSTIVDADEVIVIAQGRAVEQGGYATLLASRGRLWELHRHHFERDDEGSPRT